MDAERYAQIKALFNQAVELPEPERLGFVEQASGDDQALRDDVLEMLREDTAGNSFFDRGLPEIAYQLLESPAILMDMEEVGPYRLLEPLGQGGMGDVWLAERVDAGNRVAMKFLLHAGLSAARLERFTSEIKTQAKLEHPFIARFHDAGVLDERTPWLVMEYVEGEHLDVYCLKHALPIEKRLRLFRSVCEAVQYAHRQLIIHRDLKPSNIMVAEDG